MNITPSIIFEPHGWPMRGLKPGVHLRKMRLVASSAAGQLSSYCNLDEFPQIVVYSRPSGPFCEFDRDTKGRVRIGLNTRPTSYSQIAFQFSHEFCHAIMTHSFEGQLKNSLHSNHWLEESFCEAASLFTLRRMAVDWRNSREFQSWRTDKGTLYAPEHHVYAQDRINKSLTLLSETVEFREWFSEREQLLRKNPIILAAGISAHEDIRDQYTVIATHLLGLLESAPENWAAIRYFNLVPHKEDKSLGELLFEWKALATEKLHPFLEQVERLFLGTAPISTPK